MFGCRSRLISSSRKPSSKIKKYGRTFKHVTRDTRDVFALCKCFFAFFFLFLFFLFAQLFFMLGFILHNYVHLARTRLHSDWLFVCNLSPNNETRLILRSKRSATTI